MRLLVIVFGVTAFNLMLHFYITDSITKAAKQEVIDAQDLMIKKWKDRQDEEEGKFNI
jgi:hypothetical protein